MNPITTARDKLCSAHALLILSGAGISAESGVPTFRSGGTSLVWRGMPFEELSSARMVQQDLPLVWEWFDYRRDVLKNCKPNPGHIAIANAQDKFDDFTLVTQNIDGLHRAAGSRHPIELHGNIHQARCLSCRYLRSLTDILEDKRPPICPECSDSMRPDVVLFGESLDEDALQTAYDKAATCDVCIVVGTSAVVYPAANIPLIANREGAFVIEINPQETDLTPLVDLSLRGAAGEILPELLPRA